MKKVLLIIAIIAVGFTANAQDGQFNLGANFGLPTGDVADAYSFTIGVEANYLFTVSDEFKVGPSVSYISFLGKDITVLGTTIKLPSASFLPISGAARYNVSEKFVLGADLGYAVGISPDGNKGGLYYRPSVGYKVGENTTIQATYSGVSVDGGTFSNFGLGVMFGL